MDNPRLLHIYGQTYPHDTVRIYGTRDALEDLHSLLKEALCCQACYEDVAKSQPYFVNDGEGFYVDIKIKAEETMVRLDPPYQPAPQDS
jgi:hypothetical protein